MLIIVLSVMFMNNIHTLMLYCLANEPSTVQHGVKKTTYNNQSFFYLINVCSIKYNEPHTVQHGVLKKHEMKLTQSLISFFALFVYYSLPIHIFVHWPLSIKIIIHLSVLRDFLR